MDKTFRRICDWKPTEWTKIKQSGRNFQRSNKVWKKVQGLHEIGFQNRSKVLDSEGLCHLTNLLITQGLPKELKTAKVVVIGKPGKKDMSNPKS
jgi:hypothetical protein